MAWGTPGIPGRQRECRRGDDASKAVRLGCCTVVIYLHSRPQTVGNFARRSAGCPICPPRCGKRCFAVGWRQVTRRGLSQRAAAARPGGGYRYERGEYRRRGAGRRSACAGRAGGIVNAPASPPSRLPAPLARRRNACSRRGRLMVTGPGMPSRSLPCRGTLICGACAPNRTSRGPFPACAHIRQHAANSCRNAVYTVILHYLGTPMPLEGRGGAAEPGRLANGAVTPTEPGAKRRSGRRRWWPRPTGATVRSGRRWCRREPCRLSGPACHARPPLIGRWRCCGRVQGPRARSVPAPVARSSGERTVRQRAALPVRMSRVLA